MQIVDPREIRHFNVTSRILTAILNAKIDGDPKRDLSIVSDCFSYPAFPGSVCQMGLDGVLGGSSSCFSRSPRGGAKRENQKYQISYALPIEPYSNSCGVASRDSIFPLSIDIRHRMQTIFALACSFFGVFGGFCFIGGQLSDTFRRAW